MKAGVWYVCGFVVAFVYFYVYAVNYIRGVRGDVTNDPVLTVDEFHRRIGKQFGFPDPLKQLPLAGSDRNLKRKPNDLRSQQPIYPRLVDSSGTFLLDIAQPFLFFRLSFDYHNYTSMTTFLRHVSTIYPNLTALYSIGQSVQGREMWVMVVSTSPYEHMIGKPNVKYVANMHGNEVNKDHATCYF